MFAVTDIFCMFDQYVKRELNDLSVGSTKLFGIFKKENDYMLILFLF